MHWLIASAFIGSAGSRVLIAVLAALAAALLVSAVTVLLGKREAKVQRQLAGYELPDVLGARVQWRIGHRRRADRRARDRDGATGRRDDLAVRRTYRVAREDRAPARVGRRAAARGRAALLHAGVRGHRVLVARGDRRPDRRSGRCGRRARRTVRLSQLPAAARASSGSSASSPTRSRCSRARCAPVSRSCRASRPSRRRSPTRCARSSSACSPRCASVDPSKDALGDAADRMDSNDLRWTVMAIRIQREVGGNLAVLLDTVSDTMVKRERVRRELRAHRRRPSVGLRAEPRVADSRPRNLADPTVVLEAARCTTSSGSPVWSSRWSCRSSAGSGCAASSTSRSEMIALIVVILAVAAISSGAWAASTTVEARSGSRRSLAAMDDYELADVREQEMLESIGARVFAPVSRGLVDLARRLTPVGYTRT